MTARTTAALAAAGLAAVALTACSPNEHPTDAPGTTPPIVTGDQALPADMVNPAEAPDAGSNVETASLLDKDGKAAGAATLVETPTGTRFDLNLAGIPAGQYRAEVRSGSACNAAGDFADAGSPVSGASVDGVNVAGEPTMGSASITVSAKADALSGKPLVVTPADGGAAVACGLIGG